MSYYDETAEKAILGAALLDPRIIASTKLRADDFISALAGGTWAAIGKAHEAGHKPDLATLTPHLRGVNTAALAPLLVEVVGLGIPANADAYADTIRDRAERRRIANAMDGIKQQLDTPSVAAADVLSFAESALLTHTTMDDAAETLYTLDEFLDREMPPETWVIPELLAVGDRLVLTGVEGFGKSVLMRQIGVAVAAGINPFTLHRIPPKRVLVVDCENPERIMMARLGDLRSVIRRRGARADGLYLKRYPQGLNLAEPRERLDLHHLLTMTRPDLLLIGPAYKLYVGGSNTREEDLARLVTSQLDALREEFGFALVLEHHSPHGGNEGQRSVRPIGSSLWLRWPEFGMGLRPHEGTRIADRDADLMPWRGSRDERPWPTRLRAGTTDELPWVSPASTYPRELGA